jgi:putative MFS transporter
MSFSSGTRNHRQPGLTTGDLDMLRRLERLPMTWVQGRLLLMGGLGYTFDAMDAQAVSFILPPVAKLFNLSDGQTGLLGSSVLIGYLFGAFFAGTLGDIIGRRSVMMWALAVYSFASVFAALAPNWGFLFWSRIVTGFGVGAESAIIAPFLSEFIQSKYRGRYLGSLAGFFSFGFVFAALLGYFIVPATPSGWRIVQMITAVPILMLLWWRRALPESPRWLLERGRFEEAKQIVTRMEAEVAARVGGTLPSPATVEVPVGFVSHAGPVRHADSVLGNLRSLWSAGMARNTATIWVLWISFNFCYYGFFTWIPTLLIRQGLTVTHSFGYSFFISVAQIPGFYSAAFLNEKLDRKRTIILYMIGGGISAFFMSGAREPASIMLFGVLMSFFMNGIAACIYVYTPEVYPTAFRATGMGVASAFGRLGGIAAPIIIGLAFARIGFGGVFAMTTVVLLAGAIIMGFFGISTAGKTLEQIAVGQSLRRTLH